MVISNKKRVAIFLILIVSFFLISTLLLSSVNLFSMSKKDAEIGHINLLNKINNTSVTKMLSYSDKLKLIDYFIEYQNLKSNIKNLSKSQLNRLLNLTDILSNYFTKEELGISKDVVNQALERYDELSNVIDDEETKDIGEIIGNLKSTKSLLSNIQNMRENALTLYKQNKISKATYEGILGELSNMEYKLNLSNLGQSDIRVNLNNISYLLDNEKSSYTINADIGAFGDIDKTLQAMSGELDSINYITDFVNESLKNGGSMPALDNDYYSKIVNLANGVDINAFSNVLNFVESDENISHDIKAKDYSYPVDFSQTVTMPKIEVEGSMQDAWDLNFDTSSLCLDNLLAPVDVSLVSGDSLDNIMSSIVNVKLPNIDKILSPTALPSIMPTVTNIPTISPSIVPTATNIPTISPSIMPTATNIPTIRPSIVPTATNIPTISPSIVPTATNIPTVSPSIMPTESVTPTKKPILSDIWSKIDSKVLTGILTLAGISWLIVMGRNKKDIINKVPFIKTKQSTKQEEPQKLSKTYKQMLIDAGMAVLQDLKSKNKRTKAEKTPREIIYEFLAKLPKEEYNLYFEFLREFEEVVFYNIEVDEDYYSGFNDICQKILNYGKEGASINEECNKVY